jgi:DDE family transposase
MSSARAGTLLTILSQVPDPRGRKGRRHPLSAMLAAVVCGLLCGARGYEGLVEWLHDLPVDFWHFLGFTRRPPKKDCFRDLLMRLDPAVLDRTLSEWITQELQLDLSEEQLQAVSVDGKTLCATLRVHSRAVHLLAVVDHQTGCVLSQVRVDEKTNEHKAALELLRTLVMKGRVLVGDAMFCQREVCQAVLDSGGDYFLQVKDNQPTLLREIQQELTSSDAVFSPLRTARTTV